MCNKCGQSYTSSYISERTIARRQREQKNTMLWGMITNGTLNIAGGLFSLINTDNSNNDTEITYRRSTRAEEAEAVEEEITDEEFETLKKEVEAILNKNNLKVTPEILEEVTKKYNVMKKFNTGAHTLEQRVVNYANGLLYSDKEASFALAKANGTNPSEAFEHQGIKDNLSADDATYNKAYLNFADEYIELFDTKEGDGSIDLKEYITREASSSGIDIESLSDEKAMALLENSYISFEALDINGDNKLTREEVAAMLKTIACGERTSGTSANISYNEWESYNNLMSEYSLAVSSLTGENAVNFKDFMRRADIAEKEGKLDEVENNRANALRILKENSTLSQDAIGKIVNILFKDYSSSARGFGL